MDGPASKRVDSKNPVEFLENVNWASDFDYEVEHEIHALTTKSTSAEKQVGFCACFLLFFGGDTPSSCSRSFSWA
jgi:hypothetical protein